MQASFDKCQVLEVRAGVSKAGNEYAVLKFLDEEDLEVYELFCFGDARALAMPLQKGTRCSLIVEVTPDGRGAGVRVQLAGLGEYGAMYGLSS